jgi:hypothetical protein
MRAARVLTSRTPSPLMRIRSPCFRWVVITATKSASIPCACFFGSAWISASCSKTAFNVTTGAVTALALGAGIAAGFLAAARAGGFAATFLAGAFFAGGRAAGHGYDSLSVTKPTESWFSLGPQGFSATRWMCKVTRDADTMIPTGQNEAAAVSSRWVPLATQDTTEVSLAA